MGKNNSNTFRKKLVRNVVTNSEILSNVHRKHCLEAISLPYLFSFTDT